MKKKIIFSNCIFLLSLLACTNELKEETSSLNTIPIDVINLEEAFPNKTKETVTLQNGISFERYNDLIIWGGDMIISEKMFIQTLNGPMGLFITNLTLQYQKRLKNIFNKPWMNGNNQLLKSSHSQKEHLKKITSSSSMEMVIIHQSE